MTELVDAQHDPAEDVTPVESTVSLGGLRKRIRSGYRHAHTSAAEPTIQPDKLARIRNDIEAFRA
jgi:hypothetical protein